MINLTADYQALLIKTLVEDGRLLSYVPALDLKVFDGVNFRNLFFAVKYLHRKGYSVNFKSMKQALKTNLNQRDYISAYSTLIGISQLSAVSKADFKLISDSVESHLKLEGMKYAIAEASIHTESNDLEKAEESLMKAFSKMNLETDGYYYFSSSPQRYHRMTQAIDLRNSLIRSLIIPVDDRLHHGGFLKSQLVLIAGRLGMGKSYTLTYLARNFIEQGKKGIYFNLEMGLDEQAERLDSAFLKVSTTDLFRDVSQTLSGLATQMGKFGDNLYLVSVPPLATTAMTLIQIIRNLQVRGFTPDFIVVDGADYLSPMHRTGDSYWDAGTPYGELKQLGIQENILVLADCQIHRKDADQDSFMQGVVGTEHVAHSYLRAMVSDTFITINQTKDEYDKGIVRWYIAKQRGHGRKNAIITLEMSTERINIKEVASKRSKASGDKASGTTKTRRPKKET